MNASKTYTIKETAKISGLAATTLRYYEKIGLVGPIQRDTSSKYRAYSEDDVNQVVAIACLSATGLSIDDMRQYLQNTELGSEGARNQLELLAGRERHLASEIRLMELRLEYVKSKRTFWQAVSIGDKAAIDAAGKHAATIARKLKFPEYATVA